MRVSTKRPSHPCTTDPGAGRRPCKRKERELYGKKAEVESGPHEPAVSGSGRFSGHEARYGPQHRVLCAGRRGAGLRSGAAGSLDLRRCGYDSWKGFLFLPVLSVVLGVVLVINPFGAMEKLVMAIGIILIVEGAINLLSALYTVLAVRRFTKLHPETQSMLESLTGEDLNGDGVVAPDVTRTDAEASAVELDEVDESATVEQENEK